MPGRQENDRNGSARADPNTTKRSLFDRLNQAFDESACWVSALSLTLDLAMDLFIAVVFWRRGDRSFFAVQMSIILVGAFFSGLAAYVSNHGCGDFLLGFCQLSVLIEAKKSATKNCVP